MLKLSISNFIVSQKGFNGVGKLHSFGLDYNLTRSLWTNFYREYAPLYEKGIKQNQNKPMEWRLLDMVKKICEQNSFLMDWSAYSIVSCALFWFAEKLFGIWMFAGKLFFVIVTLLAHHLSTFIMSWSCLHLHRNWLSVWQHWQQILPLFGADSLAGSFLNSMKIILHYLYVLS